MIRNRNERYTHSMFIVKYNIQMEIFLIINILLSWITC